MAKWCFLGLFFEVLILKKVCFWCVWHCLKSVKMLAFFQVLGGFLGWLIVVHLGLEGLGVFVFLVFAFLLCVAFISVLFALFLVLWLDVVVLFLFFVFLVCFFGGFKGQVRWPKGPPHLALNPPYFFGCFLFCFVWFCLVLFFFVCYFWRV